ncbi:MAG: tryptophan synthase subunit alpha [Phycisphaerales bacterium]|nr:tryptophan synthase subunit alpha [Phycisphaerales bacterium]
MEQAIRARCDPGGKALVPFFTAGFPNDTRFMEALRQAADAGCDVVEVGVPFSDPIADGPVIQNAGQRCLERGMTVRRALDLIDRAAISVPVVLMSYVNPILAYGCDRLLRDVRAVGVRGLVIPDLPFKRSAPGPMGSCVAVRSDPFEAFDRLWTKGLERILLAAPTTQAERLGRIGRQTRGFLYAVTVTGVTGVRDRLPPETAEFLRRARAATHRPVLAGFGIASAKTAAQIAIHCDGVIIGSALIEILKCGSGRESIKQLGRFLVQVRRALSERHGG